MRGGPTRRRVCPAILAVVVAACGQPGDTIPTETSEAAAAPAEVDRAGGRGLSEVTVLRFAQINFIPFPILELWAEEVAKASDGTLQIEFHNQWRDGEHDFETRTITDVADGVMDAGWVGARAFDTVGFDSFQPLVAPLLVDSHELQIAVFEAGIAEQMLKGLDELGLVGIGALPGPLFKILGKSHPYLSPGDFAGDVIGIQASQLHADVFEALGATTEPLPAGADISGVEGYAQQLGSIWGNHYEFVADYVTGNINLWPRPLVLFANPDVYNSLDDAQRAALASASVAAVSASPAMLESEESESASSLCEAGMQFPTATASELAGLRAALQPIYDQLAANDQTSGFLEAIQAIKTDLNAPAHTVECASGAEAAATSDIDGVYTQTLTGQNLIDAIITSGCDSPNLPDPTEIPPDATLIHHLSLRDGQLELLASFNDGAFEPAFIGTYDVLRDRVEIRDPFGEFVLHWTFDGTNLVLSGIEGGLCDDEIVWTSHPWMRVTEQPSSLEGLPNGTYTITLTAEDLADSGCKSPNLAGLTSDGEWYFETTLRNGRIEQWVWIGGQTGRREGGWFGTYEVFRDRIELTDTAGTMTARWSFADGQLVFEDMQNVIGCDDIVVWATHPWVLIDSAD